MKRLQDYIAETETWIDDPVQGDEFDIELAPDSLLETHVVEVTEDGIIIEADERAMALLEQHGLLAEKIGTYGAVGYGGMGQTFFEKDEEEIEEHGGGIGPRQHWQSMMEKDDDLAIPGTRGMDDEQRHAAIMKHYPEAKRVGSTPGVYATKSGRLISGIQGVRHLKNDGPVAEGQVKKIMHADAKQMDLEKFVSKYGDEDWVREFWNDINEPVAEGAMKELDIELQDYKAMSPQQFQSAYGMKKADWAMRHNDLLQKHGLQTDWTGKTGFDYVRETSAYMSRMLELAGVADHKYNKQDDVYHEDQSAAVVARKELDQDAAQALGMTEQQADMDCYEEDEVDEAKYQGREVKLGKPFLTPGGPKKRSVYVKNPKGNVVKVSFGDKTMRIKKSNPGRRKNFRARHNCANPGPRHKARFWSCRMW